jgi:hypothetical protein
LIGFLWGYKTKEIKLLISQHKPIVAGSIQRTSIPTPSFHALIVSVSQYGISPTPIPSAEFGLIGLAGSCNIPTPYSDFQTSSTIEGWEMYISPNDDYTFSFPSYWGQYQHGGYSITAFP